MVNKNVKEEIPSGRVDSNYEFVLNDRQIYDEDNDVL